MNAIHGLSFARWMLALLAIVAAVCAAPASAAPCNGVPLCEEQVMKPVKYGAWDTKGWAYYCTGDHPYYWNNDNVLGFGNNFKSNNSCFTITENPFAEGEPSKMDATIINWCLKEETLTVTLGCSAQSQSIPCTNKNSQLIKDPNCPVVSGTQKNTCNSGPISFCIQTWEEKCSTGPVYCTDDLTFVRCITCGS